MFTDHSCFRIYELSVQIFFIPFFSWMILILLFKRVVTILVTDFYMCYKYLSFHFLHDTYSCAEDFNFNVVKVVNLSFYR